MFKPVSSKVDFPALELEMLKFWEERKIFEKSLAQTSGGREFVFYDGPPFATGLPHYGHLLAGTIKDIVPRFWTMRGRHVERRFGWDCHGLPIEALAQEELGLSGARAIRERGVGVFNEQCRSMVTKYVEEWRRTVSRMGRWVDFDNDYKTMDSSFMETIWWVFKQLWEQGRIYKAHRIMPYSWKLNTPLSNFEAGRNYQDVQDPAVTIRLRLKSFGAAGGPKMDAPVYALIWTTTPWTLPSNLALCVGPEIQYVAVRDKAAGDVYVLAQKRLGVYYKNPDDYDILRSYRGSELAGWTYEPMFPYFAGQPGAFRILQDAFVTTEDGTGIVHLAPAYGEDDYRVCRAEKIDLVDPLDEDARFTAQVPDYAGQFCKDADKAIVKRLKQEGRLVHQTTIVHSYPFCERTDTPLIYRAISAWYVRVEDLHERLLANNAQVRWVPEQIGTKRFANWLENARDWNISRNRFWGSCIPIWINEADPHDMLCVGSLAELEQLSGQKLTDLHKHIVDPVLIQKDGKTYRRTPEVLDCWFESGAMPYAQSHYPFENRERFEQNFPADFIAEGLDQTRGWFYTLMVLSTALFDRPAFKNVVVNGLVLAEDGRKMSKRLKNYPDPWHMLKAYGADALRLYMIHSPVVRAEDLAFSEAGVKQSLRDLLIPWWNAYSFFVTYARIDGWQPAAGAPAASDNLLDRWILSALDHLVEKVGQAMERYELQAAIRPLVHFIDDLTNWYIRRSRRRFWKSQDDADKTQAYATLHTVLLELSKITAPFVPFISDVIYQNLRTADMPESVHLCRFPEVQAGLRDARLERRMEAVKAIAGLGRQLRAEHSIKVRQPLDALHVICRDAGLLEEVRASEDILREELNVRRVIYGQDDAHLAELSAKPNFRVLGPRLGAQLKQVSACMAQWERAVFEKLESGGSQTVELGGQTVELTAADVLIERKPKAGLAVLTQDNLVIAIETALGEDLIREGLAREFLHAIQTERKNADFDVSQRIRIVCHAPAAVQAAVAEHRAYVMAETLALGLEFSETAPAGAVAVDVNGMNCALLLQAVEKTDAQ